MVAMNKISEIEFTEKPTSKDLEVLTDGLNAEMPDGGAFQPFAFFIRDDNKEIIAGCSGRVGLGVIYTHQLWVHLNYRKTGLGTKLIEKVHEYAKQKGCTMATLSTMSFQARGFYEKLGYVADLERFGYINNYSCIFLKRIL